MSDCIYVHVHLPTTRLARIHCAACAALSLPVTEVTLAQVVMLYLSVVTTAVTALYAAATASPLLPPPPHSFAAAAPALVAVGVAGWLNQLCNTRGWRAHLRRAPRPGGIRRWCWRRRRTGRSSASVWTRAPPWEARSSCSLRSASCCAAEADDVALRL